METEAVLPEDIWDDTMAVLPLAGVKGHLGVDCGTKLVYVRALYGCGIPALLNDDFVFGVGMSSYCGVLMVKVSCWLENLKTYFRHVGCAFAATEKGETSDCTYEEAVDNEEGHDAKFAVN